MLDFKKIVFPGSHLVFIMFISLAAYSHRRFFYNIIFFWSDNNEGFFSWIAKILRRFCYLINKTWCCCICELMFFCLNSLWYGWYLFFKICNIGSNLVIFVSILQYEKHYVHAYHDKCTEREYIDSFHTPWKPQFLKSLQYSIFCFFSSFSQNSFFSYLYDLCCCSRW